MIASISDLQQKREKTELVLMNIYNLPPIPKVMAEVLKMLDNPATTIPEISKAVSKDQSLIIKILSIANSPLFGLQRKVTSIDFAILVLGFGEIRNIISVLSMVESFRNKTDKYLDFKKFWLHSFLTGTAARKLAEDFNYASTGEAFISGFLHDIGISIMHRYFHSSFVLCADQIENGEDCTAAETSILGMPHEEIGNFLSERWNFPINICDAILNHHKPERAMSNLVLASIVHIADYMTNKLMIGDLYWDRNIRLSEDAKEILGISSNFEEFVESYRQIFTLQEESVRYLH